MPFPQPPFCLDSETADGILVAYVRRTVEFAYLDDEAKALIGGLGGQDLRYQALALKQLWPLVLTDALRKLKEHDSREWDRESRIDFRSFFHSKSLGVSQLEDVFTKFASFEGLLYGASPETYRDHIAHAFRVWVLGHGLLRETLSSRLSADEEFNSQIADLEWECMWAIAALCHDIGYPLTAIEMINRRTRDTLGGLGLVPTGDLRFGFTQQALPFYDTIVKLMASRPASDRHADGVVRFQTHLQNKYYLKLLKSFDRLQHGIVSALLVSKALVYFLESDLSQDPFGALSHEDARQFLLRREILRAMAFHTCPDIYHLQFDPLSFLLYVVDELQCWGRPTFQELQLLPADSGQAEVFVLKFGAKELDLVIRTSEEKWEKDRAERAKNQLDRLNCMLRLAVDTKRLQPLILRLALVPRQGPGQQLLLKDGRLQVSFEVTARDIGEDTLEQAKAS